MISQEKLQKQLELEQESVSIGVLKYREEVQNKSLTDLPPGRALMYSAIEPLVTAIEEFKKPSRGGGSRLHHTKAFIELFDVWELAYLTARVLISSISEPDTVQNVAIRLANMCLDHHEYLKFKEREPQYLQSLEERMKTRHEGHRRRSIMLMKRRMGIEDTKWSPEDKLHFGTKLIDLFIESTGLVERVQDSESRWLIVGSEAARKWVQDHHARCELMYPMYLPMIVPPLPWEGPEGGGFLTNEATMRVSLVKTRNREYLRKLATHDMPLVYRAINALQETPWRINTKILDVMQEAFRLDTGIGNLPREEEEPLPPTPWKSDEEYEALKEHSPEVIRDWKKRATEVYERRISEASRRFQVAQKLWIAEKFRDEEEIYFVWTMDWRGRLYPVQSFINPQGDDVAKALLEFAEGKPLGEEGAYWLAVHLANEFGYDKVSFDERVQWVRDHEDLILDSASNPLDGQRFWDKADNPWKFLAACFEWQGYTENGPDYVSHIPISVDGSCNGLQNFAAMLRDEVGGKAVNLVPADEPADVYSEVAERVTELVARDVERGVEHASVWVGKVDRNIVKRPVMTVPYGVTKYGIRDQIMEELRGRNTSKARYLDTATNDYHPAVYLSEVLYEAIGDVIVGARKVMDWLQDIAKLTARAGNYLEWVTPAGFLVRQQYFKPEGKVIRTFWGTARIRVRLSLNVDTNILDARRQTSGISPNFVHSMDASHLMLTVNKALDEGITSFAMVHDSYGTHAADIGKLGRILREMFVYQYTSTDVLQDFLDQVKSQLPPDENLELPAIPKRGTLDLEKVLESQYFFA